MARPSRHSKATSLRLEPCSFTTIMTALLPTSQTKRASPTNAGDLAWPSATTTTTAGPTSTLPTIGKNRLYHNNHDGTFTDVAEKAGVTLGGWSTGPTWGDYDHDGLLDLFVPGYVKFDADNPPIAGQGTIPPNFCQFRGIAVMCGPRGLPGEHDHLFHNNGDGTFTDVSFKAGVSDPDGYYGLAAVFVDIDDDGWVDLAVANDSTPNFLYRNLHNRTFEDVGYASGFALSEDGREQASMAIASVTTTAMAKSIYSPQLFQMTTRPSIATTVAAILPTSPIRPAWAIRPCRFCAWGAGFLDFDNDGLPRHFYRQRTRLSRGGPAGLGHYMGRASATVSQSRRRQISGSAAGNRKRPGRRDHGPGRRLRRPVQ